MTKKNIIVAWLVWGLFLLGMVFPEKLWALHGLAFLPLWQQLILIALSGGLLLWGSLRYPIPVPFSGKGRSWPWILGAGVVMGVLFFSFPIPDDFYGDAFKYRPHLERRVEVVPDGAFEALFNFSFMPAEGRKTGAALVTYLAWGLDLTYGQAFRLMDAFFGAGFLMLWLGMVWRNLQTRAWRMLWALIGLSAPFTLIFYGHIETYATGYFFQLALLFSFLEFRRSGSVGWLWAQVPIWLLAVKFHPISALFAPLLLHGFASHFLKEIPVLRGWLKPVRFSLLILVPVFLAGLVLYFFILEDHVDPRTTEKVQDLERLFLPLFSPDPPLDRYNLLSGNHVLDFLMVFFLWAPAAFPVFLSGNIRERIEAGAWLPGLVLILMVALLFMVNPLVSMPVDWDLFSLPGPLFLGFGLAFSQTSEEEEKGKRLLPLVLGIALMGLSSLLVNLQSPAFFHRFESIGRHVFKTYYLRSSDYLLFSLQGRKLEVHAYLQELEGISEELRPWVNKGYDPNFSALLQEQGLTRARAFGQFEAGKELLDEAWEYHPWFPPLVGDLLEVMLRGGIAGNTDELANLLLRQAYPSEQKARELAMWAALEKEDYKLAKRHADAYLRLKVQSRNYRQVALELMGTPTQSPDSIPVEDLKYLLRP